MYAKEGSLGTRLHGSIAIKQNLMEGAEDLIDERGRYWKIPVCDEYDRINVMRAY